MRSPLNSRTNNRGERVAPGEAFVRVAWITVMVSPRLRWSLVDPIARPARVKPGKSRQIVANEAADQTPPPSPSLPRSRGRVREGAGLPNNRGGHGRSADAARP